MTTERSRRETSAATAHLTRSAARLPAHHTHTQIQHIVFKQASAVACAIASLTLRGREACNASPNLFDQV